MAEYKFTRQDVVRFCKDIPPKPERRRYFETLKKGLTLVLLVSHSGIATWHALFYERGKPRTKKLGTYPALTLQGAKEQADNLDQSREIVSRNSRTFKDIGDRWIETEVKGRKLISAGELQRHLNTYIYPRFGSRKIYDIKRSDVNDLLDDIAHRRVKHKTKKNQVRYIGGRSQADTVLSTLRLVMQWWMSKDEDYRTPIVAKMRQDKRTVEQKKRKRVLTDDEIRAVWKATGEMGGVFGPLVRFCLLTGQRRGSIVATVWSEISAEGVWTVPHEDRQKGQVNRVQLPALARQVLTNVPRIKVNEDIVFPATQRQGHFNSFSQRKAELDKLLPTDMPNWTLHDLRRTARTLMARVGVNRFIAERTLGHTIPGVEGVYDRHEYFKEKSDALKKLADQIAVILNPPDKSNLVRFRGKASRRCP